MTEHVNHDILRGHLTEMSNERKVLFLRYLFGETFADEELAALLNEKIEGFNDYVLE